MIEAEYEMKWATIEPSQGVFDFTPGDTLASFAQAHNMQLRGHNLCWYSYNPDWLTSGNFTSSQLYTLLQTYIATVAGHFQGKVFAWDVVNEALADDGSGLRDSIWYDQPGLSAGPARPIPTRSCFTTTTAWRMRTIIRSPTPCITW